MGNTDADASREPDAPEVVKSHSDLIPAQNPSSQWPEVLYAEHYQSQFENDFGPTHEKAGAFAASNVLPAEDRPARSKRRTLWAWIIICVVLLALAVGLGVGLGLGLSANKDSNNHTANQGIDGSGNQTSSTTSSSSTSLPTEAPVTSGTTGLAQYSCENTTSTLSTSGTSFIQDCNTQFQIGHPSYYDQNVTMKNLDHRITYTFQSCLDQCDRWNSGNNTPACRAVTYYANLTEPIQRWEGNCILKNDRGVGYRTDDVDWDHTASAYMACLNMTCSGSN